MDNTSGLIPLLEAELANCPAKTSVLWSDADSGEVLFARNPDCQVVSASTIKTPMMLAVLDEVKKGALSLEEPIVVPPSEILDDTAVFELGQEKYLLWELIYWMIVTSDNTATNVIMNLVGMKAVTDYAQNELGCRSTSLQRKMLDFGAIKEGRNNYTSARDMERIFGHLYNRDILTLELCDWAMSILGRQRCNDQFLRYIPNDVQLAHKTGGLDYLNHDCGLFLTARARYYLGVFVWDAPDIDGDKRLVGRISKAIYDYYYKED